MNKPNRVNLILMELIICLLFFAISSAICVQLFVHAKSIDQDSLQQSHAAMAAANIAEAYKSKQIDVNYPVDEKGYIYLDKNFEVTNKPFTYRALLQSSDNTLSITIKQEEKDIFHLTCSTYEQIKIEQDGR